MNQKQPAHPGARHAPQHAPEGRRRPSARQRERILRERRMRRLRQQLVAALIGLGLLIAVLVAVCVHTGGDDESYAPTLALASTPEATAVAAPETPAPTVAPTATPAPTVVPEPSATPEPATTPEPAATAEPGPTIPAVEDEFLPSAADTYDATAPFSYERAYAAAVLGADTGALVVPDYSSVDPAKLDRWPAVDGGFMPMVARANTQERIIAVTVDDCFQADNLRQIVACALKHDAKLTIFPIGSNLEKPSVAEVIKKSWEYGMEIENHTYSHAGTYHYDDEGMTDDIWRQSCLLNQVLGVNYKQHFFRPKGGDERFDQRTHAYARQLGFSAIALWTQSGSVDSMNSLLNNLAPGNIYLFHTTDNDLNKITQFIPAAVKAGYRLVTLNEMFGLPANETADLSTAPAAKPALASFHVQPMTLKATAYARAAAVVQERLIELGWMHGEATGVYGKTTQACMELFQLAANLAADGVAGSDTQAMLFSPAAPAGSRERIQELAPQLSSENQSEIQKMLEEYP